MNRGVFGGSFNPIHLAHLRLAEEAREALGLDSVLFVPAADPPHKTRDLAPAAQRLEMVSRATASNPAFTVSPLELERPGPSYTVDTLRTLRADAPEARLWFLMGSDSLEELHTWKDPEEILALASLGVALRPGASAETLEALLPERFAGQFETTPHGLENRAGQEIRAIACPQLEISASDIRRRVARGASLRYLVPDPVIEHIQKHRLYGPDQEGS